MCYVGEFILKKEPARRRLSQWRMSTSLSFIIPHSPTPYAKAIEYLEYKEFSSINIATTGSTAINTRSLICSEAKKWVLGALGHFELLRGVP
jgi:hypothetical protein